MEIDEINSRESPTSRPKYSNLVKSLLMRRYILRVRQIRARRKILQKLQQFKYLQYQQASEKLFYTFSMRLLNFHKFFIKQIPRKRKKISVRKLSNRKKNKIRPQYWWKNIFPNLNDDEFYYTFHVQREIYEELCVKLHDKLILQPTFGGKHRNECTPIEKQIALCLYKLAHGFSYHKIGKIFGIHNSTACKIFTRFIRELIIKYSNNISRLEYDECLKMNQNVVKKIVIPQIIGTLMRVKFTSSTELVLYAHGIVDVDEKFHFVRIVEDATDQSFYEELDKACKKYYPNKGNCNHRGSEMYLVVTDQTVPDYDCILNKSLLESNDDTHNNDKEYIQKQSELLDSTNIMLKCEENAISKLVERWNILAYHLVFSSKLLSSVIKSCIILHNICQDYLIKNNMKFTSYDDVNVDDQFKKDIFIDNPSDAENESEAENENYANIDESEDFRMDIDENEDNNIYIDEIKYNHIDMDEDNDVNLKDNGEENLNRHLIEIMEGTEEAPSYYNDDNNDIDNEHFDQNKNNENDHQNKNDENNHQNNNENDQHKNSENNHRNENYENDQIENDENNENEHQNKNDENDHRNENYENDQIENDENDQIENDENIQIENDENDHQNKNNDNDCYDNMSKDHDENIINNKKTSNNDNAKVKETPQLHNECSNDDTEEVEMIAISNNNDNENDNAEKYDENIHIDDIDKNEKELHDECFVKNKENKKIVVHDKNEEHSENNIHFNDNKNDKNLDTDDDDEEISLDKFVVESVSNDTDVEDYDEDHSVYFYGDNE